MSEGLSDLVLLARARNGDETAFVLLYARHRDAVFRFAWRMMGAAEAAEDVAHDCFVGLLGNPGRFDPSRASLRTYLCGAARNQILKRLRDCGREIGDGEVPEVAGGDSASGVTLTSDYMVRYRAIFPPGRGREFGTFVTGDASGEHRVFFDTKRGFYYGYDIKIAKSGTGGGFLLTLGPFSAERALREMWPRLCPGCPDPRPVSSAQQRFPSPQVVAPGDKVVVDLLTDERSREVVSEEITVASMDAPPPESAPQDFRAEDVAFRMNDVQLRVEGATVPQRAVGSVRGPVVWLQLPGHGRAFFSLVPRAGYAFKKIGVVAGNKLQVSLDGARYGWNAGGPIVTPGGGAQAWNVWVLHDAAFKAATTDSLDMGGGLDERLKTK